MNQLHLFTDGSVSTRLKIGYGAYLLLEEHEFVQALPNTQVQVKRFENTSSTRLELQTLIWALETIQPIHSKILLYTDSQNIIGLPGRRAHLEQNDYRSKKNEFLKNHELYRAFFKITDQLNCELKKVKGHLAASRKKDIDRLFKLVDRASRKALRENISLTDD